MTEFTYDSYGTLLDELVEREYAFRGFDDPVPGGTVVLRHDVDWSPERARRMARIEADRGVTATYFLLVSSPLYNVRSDRTRDALTEIASHGHRVGVHFSTHEYWDDDPGPAAVTERVREEQRALGTVVEEVADAVSFHIPPDWVLGVDYEGFTNAYAPPFFREVAYVADSNQRWRDDPPFGDSFPERMQILVHPGLWADDDEGFGERLADERIQRFNVVRDYLDDQYGSVLK